MTTIKIPGLKVESPNIQKHWAKRHAQNKRVKMVVQCLMNASNLPQVPVSVTITRISPRAFDYDNLVASCKFLADAIADCLIPGLAPGRADGTGKIIFNYKQQKGGLGEYSVVIQVEPMQLDENQISS